MSAFKIHYSMSVQTFPCSDWLYPAPETIFRCFGPPKLWHTGELWLELLGAGLGLGAECPRHAAQALG